MTLDKLQTRFVDEILHGKGHVVLTGRAGTGKSTALCAGVKAAQAAQMDILVMAPTAMAASIHRDAGLESGTIHHALKWNPCREPLPRKLLSVCGAATDWAATPDQDRLLVVDEASMVGLWLFEILARDLGDPERPFDGRRLVVVGDWAQLPPVVGSEEQSMAKAMPELRKFGPPDGCIFFHPLFCRRPPVSIILEETHRANGEWFESLNRLRDCSRPSNLAILGIFPERVYGQRDEAVHMCFRRVTAHNRNAECLARLPGRPHFLPLRDGQVELKEGCDVIVTSNRAGSGYINGSRATFAGLNDKGEVVLDDGNPLKMLADGNWGHYTPSNRNVDPDAANVGRTRATRLLARYGEVIEPEAKKWLMELTRSDGETTAARFGEGRIQFLPYFPILPGYAITVHRAQGMTLPGVIVEEDCFWPIAPVRIPYVALSRVADESNVSLAGFLPSSARVRPDPAYPGIFNRIQAWSKGG